MSILAPFRHLWRRPALSIAIVIGIIAGWFAAHRLGLVTGSLLGWCLGVVIYIAGALRNVMRATEKDIRQRAAMLDEGAGVVLFLTVAAAVASVVAIGAHLAQARESSDAAAAAILSMVTIFLSWVFIHTVFAFHYAHEYYGNADDTHPPCLTFPSDTKPLYWDFIYFSFVIGMTAQVSDVTTSSTQALKLVLTHSIVSFFFNTAILVLGVGLAANLVH